MKKPNKNQPKKESHPNPGSSLPSKPDSSPVPPWSEIQKVLPPQRATDWRPCKVCKAPCKGRTDKIFCSIHCKNYYHVKLRRATKSAAFHIDKILHRNRSILLEILGKHQRKKTVPKAFLDKKKFNYHYQTGTHQNAHKKTYFLVYDFAWMPFSNGEILIVRRNYLLKKR